MSIITVRQAVLADLDELVPMLDGIRVFYGQQSNLSAAKNFLLDRFNHGESVLFIAYEDKDPAGFCQLYPGFSSILLSRTYVLNDLFVYEAARQKGVAKKLLTASIDYAKSMSAARVTLSTQASNQAAQALYQSAGWKRDEQFWVYHYVITGQN